MTDTVVYTAAQFYTMERDRPEARAVAVRDGRIIGVGSLDEVTAPLEEFTLDESLAGAFVTPGLLDEHLHPILGASTLMTEVISTEDWVLPSRTFPAALTPEDYLARLREADAALADPDEWLLTWGYHELWHGPMSRAFLDSISSTRPIGVWQRSCHEWFLNSAGIDRLGITEADAQGEQAAQIDLERGRWWENGFFTALVPRLAPILLSTERLTAGLRQLVDYLHRQGVTAFNEPGILWDQEPYELYREMLGPDDVPFYSSFLVDGRSQSQAGLDAEAAVRDAEAQIARTPRGKVGLLDKHIKLFADGAIISQLMEMKEPYLDDAGQPDPCHHGEWLMPPEVLEEYARAYWRAGWQVHTHVNGDRGLEVLVGILERCQADFPRPDHRSVIVHFAYSTPELVDRIAALGAIVSANPYYVTCFADKYAEHGVGHARADQMVRAASVLAHGIPLSFHSDLPMAPASPLVLAAAAVNRVTQSGRVAGPEERISVLDALRAVTIEAAYAWRMEDEMGSIAVGKVANFTALGEDPFAVDPLVLGQIPILGTVYEGRWFPVTATG